ncbi:MAG: DNA-3-methyladenine glycosylase 2 family protein [Candidatus Micrarchaeota archaeon]|nr:DNA-3-methyladenine glycosylase 2 family protein [Candidatus Micrarchaeota archaeon]
MQSMRVGDFDITHTIESAQPLTFIGDERPDRKGITYTCGDSFVEVDQRGKRLAYRAYGSLGRARLSREIIARFGLGDDMGDVYRRIGTDAFMKKAVSRYRGMRITRNEPWETALCFVISQFNSVKRIRGIVKRLIAAYGREHTFSAGSVRLSFRSFPSPESIAERSTGDLMAHGAGFRARYMRAVAREWSEQRGFSKLRDKDYAEAKEELMSLEGVGDKVADCILLFGYGRLEAFPIDTWIKRVVERVYFRGRKQSIRKIHEFADERWGAYAGYAQQYMFHFARNE